MDILKQLLGRLHPLVVHLPIGFIILGLLLQVYDRKKKSFNQVLSLIYLWAGLFAVLACITGYLQYLGEGYSWNSVKLHLWSGIATALFSFVMWAKFKSISIIGLISKVPVFILSILMIMLISFTGHQGGNLTHGEDYLVAPLPNSLKSALGYEVFETKEINLNDKNWEQAQLYADVVHPILNNTCVSCHNPKKSKGELVLDTAEGILNSGENNPVVLANHPQESELLQRVLLPKTHDQHMPPDGKKQPSKEEIKILEIWIENGLSFNKTIGELGLDKSIFESFFPKTVMNDYPASPIIAAPLDSINLIKKTGLHVNPISTETNYLKVSALNKPNFSDTDFVNLKSILPQIAILDLGQTQVTDQVFKAIASLPNLTILKLDNSQITGEGIQALQDLVNLKSINLSNTNWQHNYLKQLEQFKALENVYLFNAGTNKTGTEIKKGGRLRIEYGNYELLPVKSDSILY